MNVLNKIPIIKNLPGIRMDKKSSPVQFFNFGDVTRGSFAEFLLSGNRRLTATDVMRFYRQSSAVSMAIDKIAQEVEKIKPVLLTEDGAFETDHEVLDLLNNPNGFETHDEFIGQVSRHFLLTHDSIIYAEGMVTRPPNALWAVKPQALSIIQNMIDGYPNRYTVSTGMGQGTYERIIETDGWVFLDGELRQIYQIRGFSSQSDNTFSDSPLESIALEVRQQINGRFHNLRLLENGAKLSLIAIFKDELDEGQLEQRRQTLNEHLGGPNNAGKIATINSDDLEIKEVGINNKDMDFMNLDKVAVETIGKRYNIPLPLISNDKSTFNNLEKAVFQFYDWAVLPTFEKCYSGIGDMILPRYDLDPAKNRITFNPDDIDALRMRRIEELSKLIADRAITTNEYRDHISLESVEGGDDILAPATFVPIAQDRFTLTDIDDPEQTAKKSDDE